MGALVWDVGGVEDDGGVVTMWLIYHWLGTHREAEHEEDPNPLEEVDGLGAKKIQALLRHFGGRKGIEHASVRDLRDVPGIGKEMAERIRSHIQRR